MSKTAAALDTAIKAQEYVKLTLPDTYPFVVALAVFIAFECIMVGFIVAGGARSKTFTRQWMEDNFGKEYMTAEGLGENKKVDDLKGGYPDCGNGYYAKNLTYKQWLEFSVAQRGHLNFLEQLTISTFLLCLSGISLPIYSLVCGSIFFLARILYFTCKNRLFGFLPGMLSLMCLAIGAFYTLYDINSQI